jgi:multidrug efflux pump
MALSRFFIDRPVFAWVIAITIMLAGGIAALTLPVEQYPTIAPPAVVINATYPGADAGTIQNSVTQVLEQQLTGLDNLLYFSSASNTAGTVSITVTFAPGTNSDIAQVQVQNKVQQAVAQLPLQVQELGVTVAKQQANFLVAYGLYDTTGERYTSQDVSDFLVSKIVDSLARVPGVATTVIFGAQYAIRVWLDPYKLHDYALQPSDVQAAIQAQNVQVSAGQIGAQPAVPGQPMNVSVTAQSQLHTPQQFGDIILKSTPGGAVVHLRDVARIELGSDSYNISATMNGLPASGVAITPAPGANALQLVGQLEQRLKILEPSLPPGMKMVVALDNTEFIRLSIRDVVETLVEAIGLVVLVMYVFLQNWRTTLVPAVAVPVVLLGTFGVLAMAGYTINLLTLFALVLVIGLLVDDAIVVVENVERIMREEGLGPRDATLRSMEEITGALIGIGLVLTAVFLPMAFFGGSTGIIYRQFSVTIVSAMLLSIMCALVLTPALCATLLLPMEHGHLPHAGGLRGRFFDWFNRNFERARGWYHDQLVVLLAHIRLVMATYVLILVALGVLFYYLPTGFLPDEDQGYLFNLITAPSNATLQRTADIGKSIAQHFLTNEKDNTQFAFAISGFSFLGTGQNTGMVLVRLKNWADRPGAQNASPAIARRAFAAFSHGLEAKIVPILPPAVRELGNSTGFDLEMEDRNNLGHDALIDARNRLFVLAARDPKLVQVRPGSLDDAQQLHIEIDQERANALGVATSDINATLSAAWGGTFINNFIDRDRVKRVYIQGEAPYRMTPDDLSRWYVRSATGTMAPFSSFAHASWRTGPTSLTRYNGFPAFEIQGTGAPGVSSGTALAEMDKLFKQMPTGIGYELTGLSFQEQQSGAQAPALYALSILIIFLCLAALYESWAIPVSVMLVIPLGVIGALMAAMMRGLFNDIYFQVGLLTTIGLSAKNAILIVEFAVDAEKRGMNALDAALDAARLRLRPILMTSIAFIAGVMPLALAHGAGAGSQNDIGTGVIGGMITATVLAIFFVPVFFLLISRTMQRR